jgi:uncharacterized membrane protein
MNIDQDFRMYRSQNRLLDDVNRWQASGWVTPDGAAAIRNEIAARRSGIGLAGVLATLAAVLLCFGVMSFVAANWQAMPKLARLAVIALGLWTALGGAIWLDRRGQPYFANAALLAASGIFGAGIMLIAQMYHMDGHPPDAVLLWASGTVLMGLLTRSNAVLAAALALFTLWSQMESFGYGLRHGPHWGFLLAWITVAAGIAMTRWRPGMHLLAITLSVWIIQLAYTGQLHGRAASGHLLVTLIGLTLVGASIGFGPVIDRWRQISGAMLAYGFFIAFVGSLGLQFVADREGTLTLLLGALTLLAIVGVLAWAWRTDNRSGLWLAYAAFSIEIFSLYVKKIGTLLGTSAFFIVTGLLLAGLAWTAFRLHGKSIKIVEENR